MINLFICLFITTNIVIYTRNQLKFNSVAVHGFKRKAGEKY